MARLSDDEVAWLRAFDPAACPTDEAVRAADRIADLAARTPAWHERHLALLAALAGRGHDIAGARDRVAAVPACPQVVDLDRRVALSRAEWIDESLFLRLVPDHDDPAVRVGFRIVGAEPRMWYLTGIPDTMMDVTGQAVIMRVSLVTGELVLTPGSY